MPLKIDLLIIKKRRDVVIKNDFAHIFRTPRFRSSGKKACKIAGTARRKVLRDQEESGDLPYRRHDLPDAGSSALTAKRFLHGLMLVTGNRRLNCYELFKRMIQEGDQTREKLKEMPSPEIVEFKIRLAEQDAQLADNAASIAKLKKQLAEAGIEE